MPILPYYFAFRDRNELAEEVLADFYEARDIITAARSPVGWGHEGGTRQKAEWELEEDTGPLNAYFRTIERLSKKEEFFARLYARRYRFTTHFGLDAGKSYDDLRQMQNQIDFAVTMLITTYQQRDSVSTLAIRKAWEASIGWILTENDKISVQLDAIVFAIEKICRPAIEEAAK
jgi:hypothetical protein